MKTDPEIRHANGFQFSEPDYFGFPVYSITFCCNKKCCFFGHIENKEMILNEKGNIAYVEWYKLKERYGSLELDAFQIMPNHIHGIIILRNSKNINITFPTIGNILGTYKSLVSKECRKLSRSRGKVAGKLWQRNYSEQLINTEEEYREIRKDINDNPANWRDDELYFFS